MKTWPRLALVIGAAVALVFALLAAYGAIVWHALDPERQNALAALFGGYGDTLVLLLSMLALAAGLALAPLFGAYVVTPVRLSQATRLIATANPSHRIVPDGSREMRELARAINLLADRYEQSVRQAREESEAARREVDHERSRLAALVGELGHPVVVCNAEGTVLLYNNAARKLFTRGDTALGTTLLGLGRSLFSIIDRTLVAYNLARIEDEMRREVARPLAHFVTSTADGDLLRTQMAPIRGAGGALEGYILTFVAGQGELAAAERREESLHVLAEAGRAALASIRAAAEALEHTADADADLRGRFLRVIREESDSLAHRLELAMREYADEMRAQWPLEDMPAAKLADLAREHIEHALDVRVEAECNPPQASLRIDSYALLHVIAFCARELRSVCATPSVFLRLGTTRGYVEIDIGVRGAAPAVPVSRDWDTRGLGREGELARRTVRQIMERHGGEAWQQTDAVRGETYFRLLLPAIEPRRQALPVERAHESRPEFYDFDLFRRPQQAAGLAQRPLSELTYTVFDTETTGLDPARGDEIIAIGAVRIVNGRVLPHEAFEQLIDPGRALSRESARITGIEGDVLKGQPAVAAVLPLFHAYCEDTVLVAHNAAFDMRFLEMKEKATGIRFAQPVLDTLLLSAVLHPALESHRLEAIAERHGVSVVGRHTALGDAMVTAEIFLRMIPQLAELGILTLEDAQLASQRTYYARVRY